MNDPCPGASPHTDGRPVVWVSAVALVDADGRILMAQRPAHKRFAGLWEFPGGKIETGETAEQALIRELREELDISTQASCLAPVTFASHNYPDFQLMMLVYACRTWEGFAIGREGQTLTWVRPSELLQLPMPPADLPVAAMLQILL